MAALAGLLPRGQLGLIISPRTRLDNGELVLPYNLGLAVNSTETASTATQSDVGLPIDGIGP